MAGQDRGTAVVASVTTSQEATGRWWNGAIRTQPAAAVVESDGQGSVFVHINEYYAQISAAEFAALVEPHLGARDTRLRSDLLTERSLSTRRLDERDRARRELHDAQRQIRHLARDAAQCTDLTLIRDELMELHQAVTIDSGIAVCVVCSGGSGHEHERWPCRTARILRPELNDPISMEYQQHATVVELVADLIENLGAALTATISGTHSAESPFSWRSGARNPKHSELQRLRRAWRVWATVRAGNGGDLARSWFIGGNPRLGGQSPALALREGRLDEVLAAAKAFGDGTDS